MYARLQPTDIAEVLSQYPRLISVDTEDGHGYCSFSFTDLARRQLRCILPEAALHLEAQHLVDSVDAARADLEPQFSPVFAQRDRSFNGVMADTQIESLSSNGRRPTA